MLVTVVGILLCGALLSAVLRTQRPELAVCLSLLAAALTALYEKRLPLYREMADYTVSVDGDPEETCRRILEVLK